VAVVVLMLPGIGGADPGGVDPGSAGLGDPRRADPRSYKVSLTADARTATIDVDGRQLARAPVRRVYPGDHQRFIVRPTPEGMATAETVPPDSDGIKARPVHRAPSAPRVSLDHRPEFANPNGAPIID
jgi:hypothetical protein